MARSLRTAVAVAAAAAVLLATAPAATAQPQTASVGDFTRMLNSLPVKAENNKGYSRGRFDDWVTRPGGCDTRETILIRDKVTGRKVGCDVRAGSWFSVYDGRTIKNSSSLDIDHVVALAEAWGSGARNWTRAQRDRYANDLGYRKSLLAVSASSNRSKGERDPSEWLPRKADQCRYAQNWIAVKWRWRLSVNAAEQRALKSLLSPCTKALVPLPTRAG